MEPLPPELMVEPAELLFVEVDLLVFMPGDGGPNLRGRFAELGLLIGKEAFLRAGGALGPVQAFMNSTRSAFVSLPS